MTFYFTLFFVVPFPTEAGFRPKDSTINQLIFIVRKTHEAPEKGDVRRVSQTFPLKEILTFKNNGFPEARVHDLKKKSEVRIIPIERSDAD